VPMVTGVFYALAVEMFQYVDYTDKKLIVLECWRKAVVLENAR